MVAASNGTNFAAVWWESRTNNQSAIVAATVSGNGVVQEREIATGVVISPQIASNGKDYLATWFDATSTPGSYTVMAAELGYDAIANAPFVVYTTASNIFLIGSAIAYDGTNWMITFGQRDGTNTSSVNNGIFGVLVDSNHLATSPFRISEVTDFVEHSPSVAFNGAAYLCAWKRGSGGEYGTQGALISTEGVVLQPNNIPIDVTNECYSVRVASDGTNFIVATRDMITIRAVRVSGAGQLLDTNPLILRAPSDFVWSPDVCSADGNYICTYASAADPEHPLLEGKLITPGGSIVAQFSATSWNSPQAICANSKHKVLMITAGKARFLDLTRIGSVTNTSSFLLQNTNGQVALCSANDTNYLAHLLNKGVSPGVNWKVIDTADFDKDNQIDVLFQHTDGRMAIWFMNGTNVRSAKILHDGKPANAGWKAIAAADFNHNGRPDILFQSTNGPLAVWFMTNDYAGTKLINNGISPGSGWKAVTAYDVDVYKSSDIILRHTDGSLKVWSMDGVNMLTSTALPKGPSSPSYRPSCAGHFTLQTAYDLVWEMPDRRLGAWEMDTTNYVRFAWLNNGVLLPSGWHVVARR